MTVTEMYNKGDIVRITKGDMIAQAPVDISSHGYGPRLEFGGDVEFIYINDAINDGYTVEIIKKAPIPIPTKPGIYQDEDENFWVLSGGDWPEWTLFEGSGFIGYPQQALTRLVPEGEK